MGLFDFFKSARKPDPKRLFQMNEKLYMDISNKLAVLLVEKGTIHQPILKSFDHDHGLFERIFMMHFMSSQLEEIKNESQDKYMSICGSNIFGAGAYIFNLQNLVGKSVDQFSQRELEFILGEFTMTRMSIYEQGLESIGIDAHKETQLKKSIDQITLYAIKYAKDARVGDLLSYPNMKAFMQALYNAGITVAYGFDEYDKAHAKKNKSEIFYLDDNNGIVSKENATHSIIRETDENGMLVRETFSVRNDVPKVKIRSYEELTDEEKAFVDKFVDKDGIPIHQKLRQKEEKQNAQNRPE